MAENLTLQQQRQAIREGVTASRGTGAQMAQRRRAIDNAMIERRTGKQVVADVNSLNKAEPRQKLLPETTPVGSLPPLIGVGPWNGPGVASPGGGIASPLLESATLVDGVVTPDREYWPGGLLSSDGLFVLPSIKTLNLIDANGAEVQIQLAAPAGS